VRAAMKVLFTTEYYPPFAPGGSPWSIRLLAEALAARGHEITVVTPNYGAAARETVDGVTVARYPFWRRLPAGAVMAPTRDTASPRFHFRMFRAAADEARRMRADVLHAQDKHALVGTFVAARRLRRPVFLTVRDTGLLCPITTCLLTHDAVPPDCSSGKLQRECAPFYLRHYIGGGAARRARVRANLAVLYADARLKRRLVNRVDGLVSVSRGLLDIYLKAGYGRANAAHVIYTLPPSAATVDPGVVAGLRARLGLDGRRSVLYCGKLSLGKGGPVFLEAAQAVAVDHRDVTFLVAGPDEPPTVPGTDVRWLGRMPYDDMAALYAVADVVVVPSVGPEALSRVPLEAAAAGRPTIGARAGGIPEEIDDRRTGLLVERNNTPALAAAMRELLDLDDVRRRLGDNARRFLSERFDPDAIVTALIDVYRRVAA